MIVVISPAKTLDFDKTNESLPMTEPEFLNEARILVDDLKEYDISSLSNLMKISNKLGELNKSRFEQWTQSLSEARQCLLAFKGDVYKGLDVGSFTLEDFFYTNDHLRILCGLYGILRPFDGIQPYRLEMSTKVAFDKYKNLYDFWGEKLINRLEKDIRETDNNLLINLASYEYYKSIENILNNKDINVITPIFKEYKNGEYKIVSFKAKRARGLMTSYIMKNKLNTVEEIKDFKDEGYKFNKSLSNDKELVFTRDNTIIE